MSFFLSTKTGITTRLSLLILLIWLSAATVLAENLTISYFQRPPYYYTDATGQPGGFLVERTVKILQQAGIDATFISLTPYRILYVLRHSAEPHCSIGWFKTVDREQYSKFSVPIYRNQELVLLTSKAQQHKFAEKSSLQQIFSDRQLTLARMGEFSYGSQVDNLLGELNPKSLFLSGQQSVLLEAVFAQQATYMLVAPEEIEMLIQSSGAPADEFALIRLTDMPAGNLRYLICSQTVSDESLQRLNRAINKLFPALAGD